MKREQIIGTEDYNRQDKLDFYEVKQQILDKINSEDHYVPYDFIKGIILSNFTSTRWSNETTYGLKHQIERLYTEVMNNGKSYYCSNDWCKCAIYDINMYNKYDNKFHNKFEMIIDEYCLLGNIKYNENADKLDYEKYNPFVYVTTPNTIIQEGCNWWFKVKCGKYDYVQKYIG